MFVMGDCLWGQSDTGGIAMCKSWTTVSMAFLSSLVGSFSGGAVADTWSGVDASLSVLISGDGNIVQSEDNSFVFTTDLDTTPITQITARTNVITPPVSADVMPFIAVADEGLLDEGTLFNLTLSGFDVGGTSEFDWTTPGVGYTGTALITLDSFSQ